jgi:hypothetical protein
LKTMNRHGGFQRSCLRLHPCTGKIHSYIEHFFSPAATCRPSGAPSAISPP